MQAASRAVAARSAPALPPAPLLLIPGLVGSVAGLTTAAVKAFPSFTRVAFNHRDGQRRRSFEELAELALESLPTDEPAYICGESFGGPIALTLARRHPERVRGLILLATFAYLPLAQSWRARVLMPIWSQLIERAPVLAYSGRVAAMPGQFGRLVPASTILGYLREPLASGPDYQQKVKMIARFDARPWLHEVTSPSIVILGKRDPIVAPRASRELARLLPHSTRHELPCGHLSYLAMTATLRDIVEQWRSDLELPAS
jgi:pimeloyl-ACP methyl ester carboxylesterase